MARRKQREVLGHDKATFEILVVLAIVAIVALTGQVLIHYNAAAKEQAYSEPSSGITGNVVAGSMLPPSDSSDSFIDIAIDRIEVNPQSPLIGDPFEVKVYLKNQGTQDVTTPFIVELHFEPKTEDETRILEPIVVSTMMSEVLPVGKTTTASVLVTTIVPEGPMKIVAVSDSTGKLTDENPANNILSKTLIIAVE